MEPEPADSPGVAVPPPFFFVAAMAGGALLRRWAALPIGGGAARVIAAWLLVGLSAATVAWSFVSFFKRRTTIIPNQPARALVVDGPYRLTRNPMYVGLTLLSIGFGLWLNTWWVPLLLVPALAALDRFVIAREEAYLRRRFGAEYDALVSRVRRWI